MWLKCVWADCSALMSDCPPQHVNAPSHNERYLGRQADGVPVRRRKLQLPSEDLIEQLLLHIVLTAERKMREKERTTYLSTPLKTPNIKYKTKLSSPLTFWREGIHTAGCRWSLPPPRYPPSDHTYTHTHTVQCQFTCPDPAVRLRLVSSLTRSRRWSPGRRTSACHTRCTAVLQPPSPDRSRPASEIWCRPDTRTPAGHTDKHFTLKLCFRCTTRLSLMHFGTRRPFGSFSETQEEQ